jgi:hypothetical protein
MKGGLPMFRLRSNHSTAKRRIRKKAEWKRCDARIKNLFGTKDGKNFTRSPRCKNWAMANGRCRVHGGASTGPRTAEGKARVVAAMVEGRRKMVEQRHAEGKRAPGGRRPKTPSSEREQKLAAQKAEQRRRAAEANRIKASAREAGEISPRARRRQIIREVVSEMEREAERAKEVERAKHEECLNALAEIDRQAAMRYGWTPTAPRLAEAVHHNSVRLSGPTADRGAQNYAAARALVVGRDGRYRWRYGVR